MSIIDLEDDISQLERIATALASTPFGEETTIAHAVLGNINPLQELRGVIASLKSKSGN